MWIAAWEQRKNRATNGAGDVRDSWGATEATGNQQGQQGYAPFQHISPEPDVIEAWPFNVQSCLGNVKLRFQAKKSR